MAEPAPKADFIDRFNHQNMLGHVDVSIVAFDWKFLFGMNAEAGFFNSSTHRLRLMMVTQSHIERHLDILDEDPTELR